MQWKCLHCQKLKKCVFLYYLFTKLVSDYFLTKNSTDSAQFTTKTCSKSWKLTESHIFENFRKIRFSLIDDILFDSVVTKLNLTFSDSTHRELLEKYNHAYILFELGLATKTPVTLTRFRGETQIAQNIGLFILFWKLSMSWIQLWYLESGNRKSRENWCEILVLKSDQTTKTQKFRFITRYLQILKNWHMEFNFFSQI